MSEENYSSLRVGSLQSADVVDCGSLLLWCPRPKSCLQITFGAFNTLFNNSIVAGSSCLCVWNSVIWLPAIISSLFAVLIDTSVGLVSPQNSSFTGWAPNISSIVCDGRDGAWFFSKTWAPRLAPPLGVVDSSVVVVSSTCAPAVPPVLLSLSLGFESPPFFYIPFCLYVD